MSKVKFNIGEIKQNARTCGQRYYWRSVGAFALITLLSVVSVFLIMIPISAVAFANFSDVTQLPDVSGNYASAELYMESMAGVADVVIVYLITLLATLALTFFFFAPLSIGYYRFLLKSREVDTPVSEIFAPFKKGYIRSVGFYALYTLKIFGWVLLSYLMVLPGAICMSISQADEASALMPIGVVLMIAGIIGMYAVLINKAYKYEQGMFALAENPELSVSRAFEIGKNISKGYVWKLFLLDLSYIGWHLLASITSGVGYFFIIPVPMAGKAEAFTFLKSVGASNGYVNASELPGFTPSAPVAEAVPAVYDTEVPEKVDGE